MKKLLKYFFPIYWVLWTIAFLFVLVPFLRWILPSSYELKVERYKDSLTCCKMEDCVPLAQDYEKFLLKTLGEKYSSDASRKLEVAYGYELGRSYAEALKRYQEASAERALLDQARVQYKAENLNESAILFLEYVQWRLDQSWFSRKEAKNVEGLSDEERYCAVEELCADLFDDGVLEDCSMKEELAERLTIGMKATEFFAFLENAYASWDAKTQEAYRDTIDLVRECREFLANKET